MEDMMLLNLGIEGGAVSQESRCPWKLGEGRERFSAESLEEPALLTP